MLAIKLILLFTGSLCLTHGYNTINIPTGDKDQPCGEDGIVVPNSICSNSCDLPSPIGSCNTGYECCGFPIEEPTDEVIVMEVVGAAGRHCGKGGIPILQTVCSKACENPMSTGTCDAGLKCCSLVNH